MDLDKFRSAMACLSGVAWELRDLSKAMARTGNTIVHDELSMQAGEILTAVDAANECWNEALQDGVDTARQGTANVITAILAGIRIADATNDHPGTLGDDQ